MKKAKLAASLIAVSMAATTLLTGCNGSTTSGSDSNTPSGSGTPSGSDSGTPSGSDSGTPSGSDPTSTDIEIPTPAQAENLPFTLTYPEGTKIRIAAGYNSDETGITFIQKTVKEGLDLSDGKHYTAGMLKPTWQAVADTLKVTFEDKYSGKNATKEFENWQAQLDQIDIVAGTAKQLNEAGVQGSIVDLSQYLDKMPNFKKYLDDNPIVRMSITGYKTDGTLGAIYFAPYFDGVNDIERMPLMRTDWVEKLLNGTEKFTAEKSGNTTAPVYEPYMPTEGTVTVDVAKDGKTKETVTKDYSKYGNIIKKMNEAGLMTGVDAVNMLRDYIDQTYGGYYKPENRADLFIGQNAAWDADELVALLRCVVANAQTLNGTDEVQGLFSREDGNNQRRVDLYKLAGILFGARGMESRQEWLYVGNDKKLHDARQEPATYKALEKMNQMAKEGLISESFIQNQKVTSTDMVEKDLGFMSYDYNQTQTIFNEKVDKETEQKVMDEDEKYRAVIIPVAKWSDDGTENVKFMRFTESWRSVKDSGWSIPKATEANTDVLNACLHLFDYAFSADGQILMSYGPDAFIQVKNKDGKTIEEKYETFNFNGVQMPKITQGCYDDLWKKESGNFTNFARKYLGSTLHFVKTQAFETECTTAAGREGAQLISNAISSGVIKHPVLSTTISNSWYISVPTILPVTSEETAQLAGMTELGSAGNFNTGKDGTSMLAAMISNGYDAEKCPGKTAEEVANKVATDWQGEAYLQIKRDGWDDILSF